MSTAEKKQFRPPFSFLFSHSRSVFVSILSLPFSVSSLQRRRGKRAVVAASFPLSYLREEETRTHTRRFPKTVFISRLFRRRRKKVCHHVHVRLTAAEGDIKDVRHRSKSREKIRKMSSFRFPFMRGKRTCAKRSSNGNFLLLFFAPAALCKIFVREKRGKGKGKSESVSVFFSALIASSPLPLFPEKKKKKIKSFFLF